MIYRELSPNGSSTLNSFSLIENRQNSDSRNHDSNRGRLDIIAPGMLFMT